MATKKATNKLEKNEKNGAPAQSKSPTLELPSVWSRAFTPNSSWPDKVRNIA
jgi:hypothetical protein